MPDPADDEPEVEDVESVAAGLLPPRRHAHDYKRVHDLLAVWRREEIGEGGEEGSDDDEHDSSENDSDDDFLRNAPASHDESNETKSRHTRLSKPPAGLSNSGNTCFAASALQCLLHTKLLTAHFSTQPHRVEDCVSKTFCVTCEYQDLVERSLRAKPGSRHPIGKLTSSIGKIAKHFVRGRQEDSHEYIRSVLDSIHVKWLKESFGDDAEKVLDNRTQETTMIYHTFGGYTCGRVVCGACGHESRTYQSTLDIPIEVAAGRGQVVSSLGAAMRRNFCETETLDGANKYKCGGCHSYVKAERGSKIHVSPNTLVVPVKRYQLGRAGKITKFVEYQNKLDLSEYMSEDAPYEGSSAPTYTLFGVVVHLDFMGSANSGHYVSFVKLLNGQWCKCNDGSVTKTTEQTVLKQKAYLLFYERDVPRESGPIRTERQQLRMENLLNLDKKRTERIVARRKEMQAEMMGQRGELQQSSGSVSGVRSAKSTTPLYTVKTSGIQARLGDSDSDSIDSDDSCDSLEDDSLSQPWPTKLTVSIKVPSVTSAKQLRVEMTDSSIVVGVKKIHQRECGDVLLVLNLPFPVEDDDAGVVFASRTKTLVVTAPVKRWGKRLGREHGAFLAAAQAREAKANRVTFTSNGKLPQTDSSSTSEWEDDDAQQGSASDGDAGGLAENMRLLGVGTSPTTRAKRRAEGARA